jgi:fibro-slime domain-containing protein
MAEVFGGGNKNRNFTYEAETVLTYLQGTGQKFKFSADDDLWVFVDGRLVVDLGGCHEVQEQVLELDRLDWLVDTEHYTMKIFYANRLKNTARLRIETNGLLLPGSLPGTWGQYD